MTVTAASEPQALEEARFEFIKRRYRHPKQKIVRDAMRAAERCINGSRDMTIDPQTPSKNGIVHGKVVSGGKCAGCLRVHRGLPRDADDEVSR